MKRTFYAAMALIILSFLAVSCEKEEGDTIVPTSNPNNNSSLEITFSTNSSGFFAPAQLLAVWVCDENDNYVKSLTVRGDKYIRFLDLWESYSNSDKTDAITGASLNSDSDITTYWNFEDHNGETLGTGTYKIYFEGSSNNSAGPNRVCEIELGSTDNTFTFDDDEWFKDVTIRYTAPE